MNDSYFALACKQGDTSVVVKLAWDSSWTDICDSFTGYLQACGFIVDGADVASYFQEVYGDLIEAKEDE